MTKWISVKDKLPDKKEALYLVTIECGLIPPFVDMATWIINGKNKWDFNRGCVTAWQEIPEPYEEDKE